MYLNVYIHVYVFVYTYVHVKVKEGVRSLRTGVIGVYGMSNLLHRNWDLNSSSQDCTSSLLNHWTISPVPIPTFYFWDFLHSSDTNFWRIKMKKKCLKATKEELTGNTRSTKGKKKTVYLKLWWPNGSTLYKKQSRTHNRHNNTTKLAVAITIFINFSESFLYKWNFFHGNGLFWISFALPKLSAKKPTCLLLNVNTSKSTTSQTNSFWLVYNC